MAIKIVYENKAVGTKGNVTNAASEKQDFVDLSELNNEEINIKNYGTLEGNNWLLSDDVSILPDDLETPDLGYWSTHMSDDDGNFENAIAIIRTYNGNFTAPAITLYFDTYNNIYAKNINVKWYRDDTLLYDNDYVATSSTYSCMQNVTAFNKIVITITSMNKASRYLKIFKIDDGIVREFYKDEIVNLEIKEEVSDTGESISINTMNVEIQAKSEIKILFQRVQALKIYNNDELYGTFFVEESERTLNNYKLTAYDYVGMLDNNTFLGGMYSNANANDLITDILGDIPFELDESLKDITITGYLGMQTCREALMQVAFVLNAIVDTSRNELVRIYPMPALTVATEVPNDRVSGDMTEKSNAPYTQIKLTKHSYIKGSSSSETEIYNDTLTGTITLTFSNPYYNLSISGGTIVESDVNYAIITGTGSNVTLTGYEYTDVTSILNSYNPLNTTNSIPNIKEITGATLVNSSNASSIMSRLENVLYNNNKINIAFLLDNEKVGDYVTINTSEGTKTGQILSLDYELKGNTIIANSEIREVTNE